jgi:hypothetical protein
MEAGPYTVVPNKDGRGFDVVRMAPTVVSTELKRGEADALSFALNAQLMIIEGKLK